MAKLTKNIKNAFNVLATVSRFGGSLKFDSTPGGGLTAGPSKSASNSAGVKLVGIFVNCFLEGEQEQSRWYLDKKARSLKPRISRFAHEMRHSPADLH